MFGTLILNNPLLLRTVCSLCTSQSIFVSHMSLQNSIPTGGPLNDDYLGPFFLRSHFDSSSQHASLSLRFCIVTALFPEFNDQAVFKLLVLVLASPLGISHFLPCGLVCADIRHGASQEDPSQRRTMAVPPVWQIAKTSVATEESPRTLEELRTVEVTDTNHP